ncbi:MAG: ABC transporter ATP-binding protein [Deltaproteobacteria bacterium]|nr:ABC transporter ATP-binding protein [Deltaproteobacteria bacterium]
MSPASGLRALTISGITAGYGSSAVLHDLSFELGAGEMLAIVGPNGAGKSTLLKVAGGSLRPWHGSVELLGLPLASYHRRELARIVATVAQENQVAFRFTVLEIVLMGRAPHLGSFHLESNQDLAAAHAAMERFELLDLTHRPINELSGGERKRVFLARALAQEPRVILLDEPTAFLDLRHVAEILVQFRKLCTERGLAVAATMHDLNAAASHADRVMLLNNGAMVACGPPDEVLTAANLEQIYQVKVHIGRNPVTGTLAIFPSAPPLSRNR